MSIVSTFPMMEQTYTKQEIDQLVTELRGLFPTISAADNGKFLRVVNGAWAAATVENANGVSF